MLERVEFKNFKALADVTVTLAPLTVIVGANGAGKTSVLEGIDMLGRVADDVVSPAAPDASTPFEALASFDLEHFLTIDTDATTAHVAARFSDELVMAVIIDGRRTTVAAGTGPIADLSSVENNAWPQTWTGPYPEPALRRIRESSLRSSVRLRLDPRQLAVPSVANDAIAPPLAEDGSNLASIIAYLLATRSAALESIEADLREVVPQIGRVRVMPTRIKRREQEVLTVNGEALSRWVERSYAGSALQAEIAGRGYVPAHMLSDGTLITLGILAALHGPKQPELLLLDDIDRGLHPTAQRKLVECLRRLQREHPNLQIVCTSHSPYLLDALEPEEVRVMKLDAQGHAHCKVLTDHPEWSEWKGSMTAGEFWSSFGEDWVYGEEPGAEQP